jgi:alkylated DNA repair dioxygenase AlkB
MSIFNVSHVKQYVIRKYADQFMPYLKRNMNWQETTMTFGSRVVKVPRLVCLVGDSDYRYSGIDLKGNPWNDPLSWLRRQLVTDYNFDSNGLLLNYYRNGRDSIGLHSDDERDLVDNSEIFTVSFGVERTMKFSSKFGGGTCSTVLGHGDLFIMGKGFQSNWMHGIDKVSGNVGERISLTFRQFN